MTTPRNRPTGVDELTPIRTVSPVPEHLRVAVLGGGTQLDISLPADVKIADVAPYLARLIAERERTDDEPAAAGPELTSRTVLHTAAGATLPADVTLRDAGVRHGDMLYLTAQRTLHPPALYDDVVDAAAQLNRAASAAWGPASAAVMAMVALYACVGILMWMAVDPRFTERYAVIVGMDVAGGVALVAAATVARRIYRRDHIAAGFGWAAMLLGFGAVRAGLAGAGGWGLVASCAATVALTYGCYRLIGTGSWGFLAGGGFAALAGTAWALHSGFGVPDRQLGVAVCLAALVLAFAVPWLTRGWDRFVLRANTDGSAPTDEFADPFNTERSGANRELADTVPSAEEVMRRGHGAAAVRCGLYTAAGATLALGAEMLAHSSTSVVALVFTMLCGTVLALQLRTARSAAEQAALLTFGVAVVLRTVVAAALGPLPVAILGLVALGTLLVGGVVTGVLVTRPGLRHRRELLLDYLGYVAVGALIPVALAVVGLYDAVLGR